MAKCDQEDISVKSVESGGDRPSDLYLRYVLGWVDPETTSYDARVPPLKLATLPWLNSSDDERFQPPRHSPEVLN